jgi:aminoglycoside phosphotransferase (APT) family kinase protein
LISPGRATSLTQRYCRWHEAVRTLAKLHRADRYAVGLGEYGKPAGFYNRQIATLSRIQDAQSKAVDVETKEAVGELPHWKEMTAFFSKYQPQDRSTLIHGDYKIDNLVYHKTEPRVIGILDWEMSTVGHPLSDLSNLLTPYMWAQAPVASLQGPFAEGKTPGLPSKAQVLAWYAEVGGWDPAPVVEWGAAFSLLRNCVIVQGIAARIALRQASSAQAKQHAERMPLFAEYTFNLVENLQEEEEEKQAAEAAKSKL